MGSSEYIQYTQGVTGGVEGERVTGREGEGEGTHTVPVLPVSSVERSE